MTNVNNSPSNKCPYYSVIHEYEDIQISPTNNEKIAPFSKGKEKLTSCIFTVYLVVSVTLSGFVLAWICYISMQKVVNIEIIRTTTTTTTTTTTNTSSSRNINTTNDKLLASLVKTEMDGPYLDLAENGNNVIFFKPPKNICFIISLNGTYHLTFSVTLNCKVLPQKQISIAKKIHEKPKILMKKKLCGEYNGSCFEQKLFNACEHDRVCWKSDTELDGYDGNFVSLNFIEPDS